MIPFSLNKTNIACPYGLIGDMKSNYFGVNKYTNKIRDACQVNETAF